MTVLVQVCQVLQDSILLPYGRVTASEVGGSCGTFSSGDGLCSLSRTMPSVGDEGVPWLSDRCRIRENFNLGHI